MNSDNYEFSKSSAPQSVGDYTAYAGKQWNYINDINSGIYQQNGLSLVQWDLTSIYNGGQFTDVSDLYMAIPITMAAAATTSAGVLLAPPKDAYALCSLKSNYQHLIHQIEIVANGKVVNDMQPFQSVYENFKLLSQMSATDLGTNAQTLGLSTVLDNEKSVKWTTTAIKTTPIVGQPGVGLCNNLPFSISNAAIGPAPSANIALATAAVPQNTSASNTAIYNRVSRYVDASAGTYNNIVGSANPGANNQINLISLANLQTEFKPYYTTSNNVMVWNDIALIPLKYMCDCIDKMGLVKKCDLLVRAYFNTGSIQATISDLTTSAGSVSYKGVSSSFSQTCPMTINYLPSSVAPSGQFTALTALITAGVYIGSAPSSFGVGVSVNISAASSILSNNMKACRMYYSQVALAPSKAIAYVEANTSKQVVYENFLFNQYSNITSGSSFSQLVQSGIKNPIGIAIIPIISPLNLVAYGEATTIGITQFGSCYDTFPATYSPCILSNLQVQLGGVNVLNSSLFYGFENFIEQVALAESLTSSDIGISVGLINQPWWENNRVYWVDLARGTDADKATTRNLNISFTNSSNVIIDVLVFTVYLDRFVLNVETGAVKR